MVLVEVSPIWTSAFALDISSEAAIQHAYEADERELRATPSDQNPLAELHEPSSKAPQNCSKWERPPIP